jgi:uncharacterized membrane protein YkvA (DUF1232 family)
MMQLSTLKQKTHSLNIEIYTYYLSFRDKRVQWYVKMIVALTIGYAISPIDFVPDLIPVFGFLDDVVLVTLGFHYAYHFLTRNVLGKAKVQAFETLNSSSTDSIKAYRVINYAWLLVFASAVLVLYKLTHVSLM